MDFDLDIALRNFVFDEPEISDDMLLIDFADVDFDTSDSFDSQELSEDSSVCASTSRTDSPELGHSVHVVKSVLKKRGSKFMKKNTQPVIKKAHQQQLVTELPQVIPPKKLPLYVFPSFDKCDSLVFLPTTLTRHLNTGDIPAVRKLLTKHLGKNCNISIFHCFENMSLNLLLSTYQLMDDMQPDRIMCVSSTRVVDNQIRAHAHMKFTDSKVIHDSVVQNLTDPVLKPLLQKDCREEGFKHKICSLSRSAEEEQQMLAMVESQKDLTVYVNLDFVLTFDDFTKKVTSFACVGTVTSLQLKEGDSSEISE